MRVGVMGATGLVGTEMLRILEERAFPVDELRVYASPRSEGRKLRVRRRRGHLRGVARRLLRRPRPRDRRRRRPDLARMGAAGGRARARRSSTSRPRSAWTPTCRSSSPRSIRTTCAHAEGHRVVPELHDDGPRHRARAAAPRRAHRPHGRVDVPVGVGRRAGRHHELDAQWTKLDGRSEELAARPRSTARSWRARSGRSRSRATSSRSRVR